MNHTNFHEELDEIHVAHNASLQILNRKELVQQYLPKNKAVKKSKDKISSDIRLYLSFHLNILIPINFNFSELNIAISSLLSVTVIFPHVNTYEK